MYWNPRLRNAYLFLFGLCIAIPAQAITIDVNFATGTLFSSSADFDAKAAISAAAADVSTAITTSLNAITNDVVMGVNGTTIATFDTSFFYTNPSTGASETITSATIAADTITVFVGTRNITTGNTLGVGGSGGAIAGLTDFGGPPSGWVGAVANAEAQLNTRYARGGGPTIGTSSGTTSYGFPGQEITANYSLDYGISVGNLWFDVDEDNNGSKDSPTDLADYWHWDHTSDVTPGENDLYSVALHEILHAIGIGSSNSWDDLTTGTTWNGSEVQAITGSGAGLVHSDGSHIASSVMSTRISDGETQEVVMDPTITTGMRNELTVLDLAFLRDIGYETITPIIPSPPDFNGDGDIDAGDLAVIQGGYGINASGDSDNDLDTDGADFLIWQRAFTGPLLGAGTVAVPEPSAGALLFIALLAISKRTLR